MSLRNALAESGALRTSAAVAVLHGLWVGAKAVPLHVPGFGGWRRYDTVSGEAYVEWDSGCLCVAPLCQRGQSVNSSISSACARPNDSRMHPHGDGRCES